MNKYNLNFSSWELFLVGGLSRVPLGDFLAQIIGPWFKSIMDQSMERGLVLGEVPVHSTAEVPLSKLPNP